MFRLFILILTLYFYLYNPIFLAVGIGSFKIILLFAIINLILQPSLLKKIKLFRIEAFLTLIFIFLSFLNSIRTGQGLFKLQYLHIVWFVESFIAPIVIIKWFERDFNLFGIEKLFVIVGALAALITLVLLLKPDWNSFVRNSLISYSGADIERFEFVRGYGISENLLGAYAMVQGIILSICLFLLSKNFWYSILVVPLIISIAFNARTGLLAIPVAMILLLVTGKLNFKWIIAVFMFGVLIFQFFSTQNVFLENNLETFNWLFSGFDVLTNSLGGDFSSGAVETLIQDERFRPSNIFEFIFGTAQFGPEGNPADNGYFYMLWYGGWFFMSIILVYWSFMFYRLYKLDINKYMPLLLFSLLLLFNLKWNYLLMPSGISRLIGLYYVWKCLQPNKTSDNSLFNNSRVNDGFII